jgi:lysozyme
MEAYSGKQPIIYTDLTFHREVLEGEFTNYHFWLRSVATKPEVKYRDRNWAFWQFTTTGRVYGVAGPVDRNSFNGTRAEWKRVLKKRCIAGPQHQCLGTTTSQSSLNTVRRDNESSQGLGPIY